MFIKHDTIDINSRECAPGGLSAGSAALCGSGRAPGAAPGAGLRGFLLCDSHAPCHADPGLACPGFRASLVGPGWLGDGGPGRAAVLACTCFAGGDSRTGPWLGGRNHDCVLGHRFSQSHGHGLRCVITVVRRGRRLRRGCAGCRCAGKPAG